MSASGPPPMVPWRLDFDAVFANLRDRPVLVIGDLMLDHYIWGDAVRISPEAPVPVVHVQEDTYAAGGAANVALNLSTLGIAPTVVGVLGSDPAGRTLRNLLEAAKVRLVTAKPDAAQDFQTIEKTRVLVRNQQLCRIDRELPRIFYNIDVQSFVDIIEPLFKTAEGVIISDYGKGIITKELTEWVRDRCQSLGKPLAYDPKPSRLDPVPALDLLTPNRAEATLLAGLPAEPDPTDIDVLAARIHERYCPKELVITLGREGMAHCREGKIVRHYPTYAREVFDVSGAGDTVIAALLAARVAGIPPELAIPFANCAAGVVVGKVGTATATPGEVMAFAQEHLSPSRED